MVERVKLNLELATRVVARAKQNLSNINARVGAGHTKLARVRLNLKL
jgi:hypothetical protein